MPISIDEFETAEPDADRSTAELLVEFLLEHREQAFTRGEIAEAIDRAPNTVGTNLSLLTDRRLLRHTQHYWVLTDDLDRLAQALQFAETLSGVKANFGSLIDSEDAAEAWSTAQPDRPHPSEASPADPGDTEQSTDSRE